MLTRVRGLVLALLPVALLLAPRASAQDAENPIVTLAKSKLKDPKKPFTLLISLKVKDDAGKKFEAAFTKAARLTRKEKGCIRYDLNRDAGTPTGYVIYEQWKNVAALEAHLKSDYIKALLAEIGDLAAGAPEPRILVPAGK